MNLPAFQRIQKRSQYPLNPNEFQTIETDLKLLIREVARLRKENVRLKAQMRAMERGKQYRG